MKDLDELKRLLAEATPGPWEARRGDYTLGCVTNAADAPIFSYTRPEDAALIAAAVNALPGLIGHLETAVEQIREYQETCDTDGAVEWLNNWYGREEW